MLLLITTVSSYILHSFHSYAYFIFTLYHICNPLNHNLPCYMPHCQPLFIYLTSSYLPIISPHHTSFTQPCYVYFVPFKLLDKVQYINPYPCPLESSPHILNLHLHSLLLFQHLIKHFLHLHANPSPLSYIIISSFTTPTYFSFIYIFAFQIHSFF